MFNSNRGSRDGAGGQLPPAPPPPGVQGKRATFSVIGTDVVVTGNVSATADLHIEGRVDGDVNCASLVQGPDSQINGGVNAEAARLAGAIEGTVRVRTLSVERSARIVGDVEYENISIETGAQIEGRLKHVGSVAAPAPTPPSSVPLGSTFERPRAPDGSTADPRQPNGGFSAPGAAY